MTKFEEVLDMEQGRISAPFRNLTSSAVGFQRDNGLSEAAMKTCEINSVSTGRINVDGNFRLMREFAVFDPVLWGFKILAYEVLRNSSL